MDTNAVIADLLETHGATREQVQNHFMMCYQRDKKFKEQVARLVRTSPVSQSAAIVWANSVGIDPAFTGQVRQIREALVSMYRLTGAAIERISYVIPPRGGDDTLGGMATGHGVLFLTPGLPCRKMVSVVWHEAGHMVEAACPQALAGALAWLESRRVGEAMPYCVTLTDGSVSEDGGYITAVRADNRYSGRVYYGPDGGKITEVISTGFERAKLPLDAEEYSGRLSRFLAGDIGDDGQCDLIINIIKILQQQYRASN